MIILLLYLGIGVKSTEFSGNNDFFKKLENFGEVYSVAGSNLFDIKEYKNLNILVMGKEDSNKEVFINNIVTDEFGNEADTVTINDNVQKISKEGNPFAIFSTPCLKFSEPKVKYLKRNLNFIESQYQTGDPTQFINLIIYHINCESMNFKDDIETIQLMVSNPKLKSLHIILVFDNCSVLNTMFNIMNQIGIKDLKAVPILFEEKKVMNPGMKNPQIVKPYGLDDLIQTIQDSLPDIMYDNFDVFNNRKLKQKRRNAAFTVMAGTVASTLSSFIPIPWIKYPVLGGSEFLMFLALKKIYQIDFKWNDFKDFLIWVSSHGYAIPKESFTTESTVFISKLFDWLKEFKGISITPLGVGAMTAGLGTATSVYFDYLYRQQIESNSLSREEFKEFVKVLFKDTN